MDLPARIIFLPNSKWEFPSEVVLWRWSISWALCCLWWWVLAPEEVVVSDEAKPNFLSTFDQECVRLRMLLLLKGIEVRELLELRWFRCKLAFELFSKLLIPSYIVSLMASEMASSAHFMTKSPDPDSELPPMHNLNSLRLAWGILQPRMLLIKKQMGLSEPTAKNFTSTEVSTIRWGPDIWKMKDF